MTKKEFDELYVGKVVHCDTEKKALYFLALADSFGYRWDSGDSLLYESNWKVFKEKTLYFVNIGNKDNIYFTFGYHTNSPEDYCKFPAHKTEIQVSVISETISTERYHELLATESKWNNLMKVIKGEK